MTDLGLPAPILFHPLKHHLYWAKEFLLSDVASQPSNLLLFKQQLRTIGELQMDLYLGKLSVREIAEQILSNLR